MIYLISDFHFGHENILRFERHQFHSIAEHDQTILDLWKKSIFTDDIVYFLGDFGTLNDENTEVFRNLSGKKIMLVGNHDVKAKSYYALRYKFDEVIDTPMFLCKRIVLSHEPIKVNDDVINVHGHLHNAKLDFLITSMPIFMN